MQPVVGAPPPGKRIAIIQGHPDPDEQRLCRALAQAYAAGARAAGCELRMIDVAALDFPWLRSKQEWDSGQPAAAVVQAQDIIAWADHLVIIYPLWLGSMPALLKGFFEQVLRPGFAISPLASGVPQKMLKDKSARIIVTMGMPAPVYSWYFAAHSLKNFKRNVLGFCGIAPIRDTIIGTVESADETRRQQWLRKAHGLGLASN